MTINMLAIERVWDTLTVTHTPTSYPRNVTVFQLASGNVTSLVLPSGSVVIEFCTDDRIEDDGFALDFRLVEVYGK